MSGGGVRPGQQDRVEDAPLPARAGRFGQPRLEHPGNVPHQLGELGVVQPQPGHPVADPVAQQVDLAAVQVAVEVAEQPGQG